MNDSAKNKILGNNSLEKFNLILPEANPANTANPGVLLLDSSYEIQCTGLMTVEGLNGQTKFLFKNIKKLGAFLNANKVQAIVLNFKDVKNIDTAGLAFLFEVTQVMKTFGLKVSGRFFSEQGENLAHAQGVLDLIKNFK